MLNVSHMNCSNGDTNYKSVTILSRPLPAQAKCGQSLQTNSKARGDVQTAQESESVTTNNCVQSISSVVASTLSLSMSSFGSPSKTNGSQPLRSTVLANNNINTNINNNNEENSCVSNGCPSNGCPASEKSPMCRINEISRYNDIKHEYHLIEESGPAHNKSFTVVLKLGEIEEFRGSGPSIKKAQRNAATVALRETKLKQPAPRMHRHNKSVWPMTPTVELNVLAMKLGQTAVYHVYEPPRPQASTFSLGPIGATGTATNAYDFRGMHYQRYHVPRGPFCATLTVGSQQFLGKGHTAQAARHAAAEEALKVVRQLANAHSCPCPPCPPTTPSTELVSNPGNHSTDTIDSVDTNHLNADHYIKSPISLVHEMALKRNWSVNFDVIDESGPSHMPKFVTKCTVAHLVTTGEGNGKKISKKNAALLMVEELNKLEPLVIPDKNNCSDSSMDQTIKKSGLHNNRKKSFNRKKSNNFNNNNNNNNNNNINNKRLNNRNDRTVANDPISNEINCVSNDSDINVKNNINASNENNIDINNCKHLTPDIKTNCIQTSDVSDGAPIHPINRLIQLQQTRKDKEPNFTLLSERIIDRRRREFTIECNINVTKGSAAPQTVSAIGLGATKKMAKKNAAEQMLQLLGYSSRAPPQSILKQDSIDGQSSQHKKIRQVKFIEDNTSTNMASMVEINCGTSHLPKMGRQLVPGLILMPKDISPNVTLKSGNNFVQNNTSDSSDINSMKNSEIDSNWNSKPNTNESVSTKIQLISSIAKEFLDSKLIICHKKPEKEDINSQSSSVYTTNRSDQLRSLVENVGTHQLQVHFSDFPKKQGNAQSIEYLSVVTITTVWNQSPIVSHGSGHTVDEARNQASHQALIQLTHLEDSQ